MTKIIAIPYKNFKHKIRLTRKFNKYYHIEDLAEDSIRGVLYMEKKQGVMP